MDPLEALLSPVARILSRNIRETTPARELAAKLDGKVIAVRVSDTALAMYFAIHDGGLTLSSEHSAEPDAVISGSLLSLARLAGGDEQTIHEVALDFAGDPGTAQAFRKLLAFAKPDVEEELSGVIGDTAAHGLGQVARGVRRWARDARAVMRGNVREYLQEERRAVPSRYEVETFANGVATLRDDVERLAARIDRLERGD